MQNTNCDPGRAARGFWPRAVHALIKQTALTWLVSQRAPMEAKSTVVGTSLIDQFISTPGSYCCCWAPVPLNNTSWARDIKMRNTASDLCGILPLGETLTGKILLKQYKKYENRWAQQVLQHWRNTQQAESPVYRVINIRVKSCKMNRNFLADIKPGNSI